MKRIGNKIIFLLVLTVLATAIVGSASWLIVQRTGSDVNAADSDTNPCFTSEAYFNGNVQMPELNELGEAVYGFDSPDDYTIEPLFEAYYRIDGTSMGFDDIGKSAGKHYYKIIDNTTGQIISERHEFVIKPDTLVATVTEGGAPSFVGDTVTFTATVVGKYTGDKYIYDKDGSKRVSATISGEYTSVIGDYTPASDLIYNASVKAGGADISDIASVAGIEAWIENNFDVDALDDAKFEVTVPLLPTCYSYVGTATADRTYYGNIDQALAKCRDTAKANASNSYTLVAMQSFTYEYTDDEGTEQTVTPTAKTLAAENRFKHEITKNVTIPSNLTLLIPYDENAASRADGNTASPSPVCKNLVTVAAEIIITNNGTITVAGVLGNLGQSFPAGATSGAFAVLAMGDGASMNNASGSNLNAFGYVTDPHNTAKINCLSGSTVDMPFAVYDFGGGTHTTGAYLHGNTAPFNIYDMPNIHAETVYSYGAKITGEASMAASGELHKNSAKILGTSDSLLNLSSGKVTIKHTPTQGVNFGKTSADSRPSLEAKNEIKFEGNMSTGALTMKLSLGSADMSKVICPVAHKFKLIFGGNATYNITSAYKLMPGSEVILESGSTVNTNGNILIYSDAIYSATYNGASVVTQANAWTRNPNYRPGAILTVNGTLKANAGIGGEIRTASAGAILNLSSGSLSVSSNETNGTGMYSSVCIYTETGSANGTVGMSNAAAVNANFAKAQYTSVNYGNGIYGWKQYNITYNWVFENITLTDSQIDNGKNPGYYSGVGKTYLQVPTTSNPNSPPYFEGWYTNAACTEPISEISGRTGNLTLYGKWVDERTYTVSFKTDIDCGNSSVSIGEVKVSQNASFNPYSHSAATSEMNNVAKNAGATHYFVGWYYDEALTNPVPNDGITQVTDDVVLYAKWAPKAKLTVTSGVLSSINIKTNTDVYNVEFDVTPSQASTGVYYVPGSVLTLKAEYSNSGAHSGLIGMTDIKAAVYIEDNATDAILASGTKKETSYSKYQTVTATATATYTVTATGDLTLKVTTAKTY